MPDNRGFYGFFAKKGHKNLQVQQAPRSLWGFARKLYKFAIYCKFIPCKPKGAPLIGIFA
jgi:hypothetical protein